MAETEIQGMVQEQDTGIGASAAAGSSPGPRMIGLNLPSEYNILQEIGLFRGAF